MKFYIIGAGNNGRNILENFPYGWITGVMDSDKNKIGQVFGSFNIQKTDVEYLKQNKIKTILSFYDEELIQEFEENNIEWYVTWGTNKKNIFQNKNISEIYISDLKQRLYYDHRLLSKIDYDGDFTKCMYRKTFFSNINNELVELMKHSDKKSVSDWLNSYYKNLEKNGMLEDEIFKNRVGLCLAELYIGDQSKKIRRYSVLDIACGHGEFLKILNGKGIQGAGIDISNERVSFLQKQGIDATYGTAEELNKQDKSYNCVTLFECLEHVINPIIVISEAYRVLKKHGDLIISVPYKNRCDCDTHVRLFDENSISWLLKDKFEIENILLIPYLFGNEINNMFVVAKKKG